MLALAAPHTGEVVSVTDLGGLSGVHVCRLDGLAGSVVAKGDVHPRELAFYEEVVLPGVPVPRHLGTVEADTTWLVLEHLPNPLPRSRWGADPAVVAVLRTLHDTKRSVLAVVPSPYRPSWEDPMDGSARHVLALSDEAENALDAVREAAQSLFEPLAVISGDTNPLNWRLDADGHPVLLDWERIGFAHPAIDLGIALPGLPSRAQAASMAKTYGDPVSADEVLVAKAWSVVEFAAEAASEKRSSTVGRLRTDFEPWLIALSVNAM